MALEYCLRFGDIFTDYLIRKDLVKLKNINKQLHKTIERLYKNQRWRGLREHNQIDLIPDIINIRNCIRGVYERDESISVYKKGHYLSDGPSSWYQTLNGYFIIEQSYHSFSNLHSPIGYIGLDGLLSSRHGKLNVVNDIIKKKLGLVMIKEGYTNFMGHHGPYYLVTKINGINLNVKKKEQTFEYYETKKNLNREQRQKAFKPVLKILKILNI